MKNELMTLLYEVVIFLQRNNKDLRLVRIEYTF